MATSHPVCDPTTSDVSSKIEEEAKQEQKHELVALNDRDGQWKLEVGDGYRSEWEKIKKAFAPAQENEPNAAGEALKFYEDSVFTISFLGNTSVGKSFVMKHILHSLEKEKCSHTPLAIDETEKCGATTANINCYSSAFHPNQKVLLLDYEGEKGPGFPLLYRAQAHLAHISRTADKANQRRKAVTDYFPKLAYILSDIVILVGTDDLDSTDCLTRFQKFVAKAQGTVTQIVRQPILIIIRNKTSIRQGQLRMVQNMRSDDEAQSSMDKITKQFFDIHGNEAEKLKQCFSGIRYINIPHRNFLERIDGKIVDGETLFDQEIDGLINFFKEKSRNPPWEQMLTYPQWLYQLEKLLPSVQSGKIISLHTMLSEITQRDSDPIMKMARLCFIRAYDSQSLHSPEWFDKCCEFTANILIYLLAIETESWSGLVSKDVIEKLSQRGLQRLSEKLLEFQPCEARYTGRGRLTENADDATQIYCYQHRGAHSNGHRTSQRVYNLSGWKGFLGRSSFDVWDGQFINSRGTSFSEETVMNTPHLVRSCIEKLPQKEEAYFKDFIDVLANYQFPNEQQFFAVMCFCKDRRLPATASRSPNPQQNHQSFISKAWSSFTSFFRRASVRNASGEWVYVQCRTCYDKFDQIWQERNAQKENK